MSTKEMLSTEQLIIKTFIPIIVFFACVHIVLLMCGIDEIWTEVFHESVGCVMLYLAINVFRLCPIFKLLVIYKFVIEMCIICQRNLGIFGDCVTYARIAMLLIGISLIITVIIRKI